MTARILVIDDEPGVLQSIAMLLRSRRYEIETATSGADGIARFMREPAGVVVLDVLLPDMSGIEVLRRLRQVDSALPCLMVTAHGSVPSAVEAMKAGAYDYLLKPFDNNDLVLRIERALEKRRLSARVDELEEELASRSAFANMVGQSESIQAALRRLSRVARNDTNVLLCGETGTGKGLAAQGVHRRSARAAGPFVPVNCAAISNTLAESELFGHVKGAFTDAKVDHRGKFEQANGGTLFLDEVGELSPELQAKLLRVVEDGQVYRVGSEAPTVINVRIVSATNRDLGREAKEGRFRSDLYWRLNAFTVEMPALRNRIDDLPMLVDRLLDLINAECRTAITGVSPEVMARFRTHAWPGNIRELATALRHGAVMAETDVLEIADLPDGFVEEPLSGLLEGESLDAMLVRNERQVVEATLARFKGNRTAAAEALGITRRTLYNKLRGAKPQS